MTTPQRIRLSRTAGWRLPAGAVNVARPGPFGNPFPVKGDFAVWLAVAMGLRANPAGRREAAVRAHRAWLTDEPLQVEPWPADGLAAHCRLIGEGLAVMYGDELPSPERPTPLALATLRGRDLACWCPLDGGPCHAITLMELANR